MRENRAAASTLPPRDGHRCDAVNLAVGVDMVEVERVAQVLARHPDRFLTRHFTSRERDQCGRNPVRLASRWAAKEAAAKALGTGIGPIAWRDVEMLSDDAGAPHLHLSGRALERAGATGLDQWSVTVTDTRDFAVAVVVAAGT